MISRFRVPNFRGIAGSSLAALLSTLLTSVSNFVLSAFLVRSLGYAGFGSYSVHFILALFGTSLIITLVTVPGVSIAVAGGECLRDKTLAGTSFLAVFAMVPVAVALMAVATSGFGGLEVVPTLVFFVAQAAAEHLRRLNFASGRLSAALFFDLYRLGVIWVTVLVLAALRPDTSAGTYLIAVGAAGMLAIMTVIPLRKITPFPTDEYPELTRRIFRSGSWL